MGETVWHTPKRETTYTHYVDVSTIEILDDPQFPKLRMVHSYREIILHVNTHQRNSCIAIDMMRVGNLISAVALPSIQGQSAQSDFGFCHEQVYRAPAQDE